MADVDSSRAAERAMVDAFRKIDQNGDGVISRTELAGMLARVVGHCLGEKEIDEVMAAVDLNRDGRIQFEEFVSWVMGPAPENAVQIQPLDSRGGLVVDMKSLVPERFEGCPSDRYDLDKLTLSRLGSGKVCVAKDRRFESRKVAIKKVVNHGTNGSPTSKTLDAELECLRKLDHPNVCRLLSTFYRGRETYFVMELCEGGELFQRILQLGSISEADTSAIVAQVTAAICHAHGKFIAHRDIKPEHVLFCSSHERDMSVKLIDWSCAMCFEEAPLHGIAGSIAYSAPEVMVATKDTQYKEACDLWSLGVLTYVMLCGKPPFWGKESHIIKKAKAEKYPLDGPVWEDVSDEAKSFVTSLLRANPRKRMTAMEANSHAWLRSEHAPTGKKAASEVLGNLKRYSESTTFTRMCISAVASQLDQRDLQDIHKVFRELDKNGDGVLSYEEIREGFGRMFGEDSPELRQVSETFKNLDLDGSNGIDYTEFCAAGLAEKTCRQTDVMWAAFKTFDIENRGCVSILDLQRLLQRSDVQATWTAEVCRDAGLDVLKVFDRDGNGVIDFDEWKELMQGCWQRQKKSSAEERRTRLTGLSEDISTYELLARVNKLSA